MTSIGIITKKKKNLRPPFKQAPILLYTAGQIEKSVQVGYII